MKVEIPTHVSSPYEDYAKGTIVLRTNRYWLVAGLDLISFGFFLIYAIEHKPNPGLKAEKTNGENDSAVSSTLKRRK
ncbi:hypothetical protein AB3S75_016722 [Citrus x aurantiifolia]